MKPVALFTARNSIYRSLGLDCWDERRNAMTYSGNSPVIAHPPCNLWGKMARVNFKRWGGDHNRPGNDRGMFRFALKTIIRCTGVIEHPAHTKAWAAHGLTRPGRNGWTSDNRGGWVCEVWQSDYGHLANKATWLFCRSNGRPPAPRLYRSEGSHQIGFQDQRGKDRNKPTVPRSKASATPIEFARYLITVASSCT